VTLAQDPHNPEFTPFPADSFITVDQLREAVVGWVFGDVLPVPSSIWQPASAWDVRWPIGSGY